MRVPTFGKPFALTLVTLALGGCRNAAQVFFFPPLCITYSDLFHFILFYFLKNAGWSPLSWFHDPLVEMQLSFAADSFGLADSLRPGVTLSIRFTPLGSHLLDFGLTLPSTLAFPLLMLPLYYFF